MIVLCWLGLSCNLHAQTDNELQQIYRTIQIDSIIVVASKSGFSVEDFIQLAIQDTTFYTAFRNLRSASYPFETNIDFYNRKNRPIAHYDNRAVQKIDSMGCRSMTTIQEKESGKIKKKKEFRFFTMKMFAKAFFTAGIVCPTPPSNDHGETDKTIGRDRYYSELKKLIFDPDQKINVPMMGQRTQIYSTRMQAYYNYSISSEIHKSGISSYSFTAEVKPKFKKLNQNKNTVIKYLKLYFSKDDFQVLGKEYRLIFNSGLYKFAIDMDIQLEQKEGYYYPHQIIYNGFWKIPFKKREQSLFEMTISPKIEFVKK